MSLGTRIRSLRKANQITQEELGKYLGVSKVSISGYENDTREPDMQSLAKLAKKFNVTTDYLLGVNQAPKWATQEDVIQLDRILESNVNMALGGEDLTPAEKQRVRDILTATFWEKLPEYKGRDKNN